MVIISEFSGRVNPFLILHIIDVVARKLFNFAFDCILLEMFRLIAILNLLIAAHAWQCTFVLRIHLLVEMLVLKRLLLVFECIVSH